MVWIYSFRLCLSQHVRVRLPPGFWFCLLQNTKVLEPAFLTLNIDDGLQRSSLKTRVVPYAGSAFWLSSQQTLHERYESLPKGVPQHFRIYLPSDLPNTPFYFLFVFGCCYFVLLVFFSFSSCCHHLSSVCPLQMPYWQLIATWQCSRVEPRDKSIT